MFLLYAMIHPLIYLFTALVYLRPSYAMIPTSFTNITACMTPYPVDFMVYAMILNAVCVLWCMRWSSILCVLWCMRWFPNTFQIFPHVWHPLLFMFYVVCDDPLIISLLLQYVRGPPLKVLCSMRWSPPLSIIFPHVLYDALLCLCFTLNAMIP